MPEPIVKALDTTIGETGPTQTIDFDTLKEDKPHRVHISLGSGDTVVIESKLESGDSFQTIETLNAANPGPSDVYLGRYWRARRTVDGGGDSVVDVLNLFNQPYTVHTA